MPFHACLPFCLERISAGNPNFVASLKAIGTLQIWEKEEKAEVERETENTKKIESAFDSFQ